VLPLHLPTPSTPFVNPISAEESSVSVEAKKNPESKPIEPVQIKVDLSPKKNEAADTPSRNIAHLPTNESVSEA